MAGHSDQPIVVYGALASNFAIAVTKFIVAGITGSSAMLSEGIHSVADTGNQALILLGIKRSQKPPDDQHPFGHGKELYFWGLVVAMVLFGIGGGLSIYEGISHISQPELSRNLWWSLGVLGISALFEGTAWTIALKELRQARQPGEGFWQSVRSSKDPSVYTVFAEDTAALSGLTVAAMGIVLSHVLEMPVLDGIASLLIGCILSVVALFLAYEARSLLIGERVDETVIGGVRRLAEETPGIHSVGQVATMQLGPDQMLLAIILHFDGNLPPARISPTIAQIRNDITREYPHVRYIFLDTASFAEPDIG